jgi:3-phosphoshikimate 1-carboxyvinyltransferase
MNLHVSHPSKVCNGVIDIKGSKSISNRLLFLQSLYPLIKILNESNSEDTVLMKNGLKSKKKVIDIGHAGTAMRFLTSYFSAIKDREIILTGSKRMKERPIKILVDALKKLGAKISYQKKEGFPPLKIIGSNLKSKDIFLPANISSQYISSLILLAPILDNGLRIKLIGEITSIPYIKMTLKLLKELGVKSFFKNNIIEISPKRKINPISCKVESDWSSASYFYSIIALCKEGEIVLNNFNKRSLQGDSCLINIYDSLGVSSRFDNGRLILSKKKIEVKNVLNLNLIDSPDIAQTIAVTCFGLSLNCNLKGLHTLKIKETDRLAALKTEMTKLGAEINITKNSFHLKNINNNINKSTLLKTYNDHRMAMAFAPLSINYPIQIENFEVVKKSYPGFWNDIESIGFKTIKS